jgi:hypothetical protein
MLSSNKQKLRAHKKGFGEIIYHPTMCLTNLDQYKLLNLLHILKDGQMSKLSLKDAQLTIKTINDLLAKGYKLNGSPSVVTVAATVLGISQRSVRDRIKTAANMHKLVPDTNTITTIKLRGGGSKVEDVPTVAAVPTVEELTTRERQRYSDTIDRLRKELRDANRTLNDGETLRDKLFGLKDAVLELPKWTLDTDVTADTLDIPMLLTSDFHYGEVIKPELVGGANKYNTEIAKERYKLLIERTIKLCKRQGPLSKYPGFVYIRAGDSISGDIHLELRLTNEGTSIQQILEVASMEAAGIRKLADSFGHVWVLSVPGNHARITDKPLGSKLYSDTNLDFMLANILEKFFEDDKRVTFYTPISGEAYFKVLGYNFVVTHGDRLGVKGGDGFIGVIGPITRGTKKLRQQYAQIGKPIDMVLLGHFHTSLEGEKFISNNCLVGYSEYAQSLRVEPMPAHQILMFVNHKVGVAGRYKVYVQDDFIKRDTNGSEFQSLK